MIQNTAGTYWKPSPSGWMSWRRLNRLCREWRRRPCSLLNLSPTCLPCWASSPTQLQGRATNRLHAELSAKLDHLAENQISADTMGRKLGDIRREARFEVITELLEVRDRFSRGVEEAQRRLAGLHGFWARFAQREVLTALVEGNLLARERLDDLLRRLDVREIPCLGQPFDPTLMQAAEVVHTTTASPGTVVDVFRPGYISNGRVLRFAEVRVVADARDTPTPQGNTDG